MNTAPERLAAALADRYRIERELGAGGMATVYLAEDLKHQRKVAVKVLRPDLAASLGPERFLREVTIAANLQHPHVLPLYDSGQADGFLFYVMPYVEGTSLRQKLVREGELPVAEAVRILRDVADAMAYAHSHGVVHRDIKPENVMLSGRHALVTDFGVAKAVSEATGRQTLTTAGVALGTPAYMAPEQAAADPHTDHRADLYAFGVVAYELLTGRPPFTGASPQAVLAAHVTTAADPVTKFRTSIPPTLAALVMRCLEKKPADRWQSAEELIPALETILTPSGGMTPASTQPVETVRGRTYRWPLFVGGGVMLAAVGGLGWRLTHQSARQPGAAAEADRSVAVLVFALLTPDSSQAYLAQGLSEDVSTALNGVPGLRVKAPSAVRRAQQGPDTDLGSLGKALGVRYLVDGSIRPVGEKLRVSVRLVAPESEESHWAVSFDRAPGEMLDLPSLIAQGVARTLAGGEDAAAAGSLSRRITTSADAYDAYLKGNFYYSQRSESAMKLALVNYQRAVVMDSNFVAARARIAMCYGQMVDYTWLPEGSTRAAVAAQGLALADAAVRRDSTSADAWVAIGYLVGFQPRVDARRALDAYQRAVALDRSHVEAHNRLAWIMLEMGEPDTAAEGWRSVLVLDPGFYVAYRGLARIAAVQGGFAKARALVDTAMVIAPQSRDLLAERAWLSLLLGDLAEAERDVATLTTLGTSPNVESVVPLLEGAQGNTSAVRAWLKAHPGVTDELRAGLLYSIGEREEALRILERGDVGAGALSSWPTWGPLQTEPRFQRVLKSARSREG